LKSLKDRGLSKELNPLIKRVERSVAMDRIDLGTGRELLGNLLAAKAIIENMTEEEVTEE
jgi:hypothetical protein